MKKTLVLLPVLFLSTTLLANNQNVSNQHQNANNQNINIKMPDQSVYKIKGVKKLHIINKNAKPGEPKTITISPNNE